MLGIFAIFIRVFGRFNRRIVCIMYYFPQFFAGNLTWTWITDVSSVTHACTFKSLTFNRLTYIFDKWTKYYTTLGQSPLKKMHTLSWTLWLKSDGWKCAIVSLLICIVKCLILYIAFWGWSLKFLFTLFLFLYLTWCNYGFCSKVTPFVRVWIYNNCI